MNIHEAEFVYYTYFSLISDQGYIFLFTATENQSVINFQVDKLYSTNESIHLKK